MQLVCRHQWTSEPCFEVQAAAKFRQSKSFSLLLLPKPLVQSKQNIVSEETHQELLPAQQDTSSIHPCQIHWACRKQHIRFELHLSLSLGQKNTTNHSEGTVTESWKQGIIGLCKPKR